MFAQDVNALICTSLEGDSDNYEYKLVAIISIYTFLGVALVAQMLSQKKKGSLIVLSLISVKIGI